MFFLRHLHLMYFITVLFCSDRRFLLAIVGDENSRFCSVLNAERQAGKL